MQLHAQETNLKITYKGLNADGQQVFELVADTEVFNRSAEAIAQAERDGQDVHVFDTLIDALKAKAPFALTGASFLHTYRLLSAFDKMWK